MAGGGEEETGDRVAADSPVTVTTTLTERDLRSAMVYTMYRRSRWLLRIIAVLAVLLAAVTLLGIGIGSDFSGTNEFLAELWPFYTVIALLAAMLPFTVWYTARRQMRSSSELAKPHVFRFDSDGFDVESAFSTGRCRWEALFEARELKELLLLYRSKDVFHLLPKRAFGSEDELGAMRALLREKLGDRARTARGPAGS